MADEAAKTQGVTFHSLLIGTAMTLISGAATYVGSHWGGVTVEQLAAAEKRLGEKVDPIAKDVAKLTADADNVRKLVAESVGAAEKRMHDELNAKRRKERRAEP